MVNGLKARFREGREKSIEDIVVDQTTTMLDKSFDSKQVADMISSYTSDGELVYNEEFITKMSEERLKALGITEPTAKQIARVANTIKSNLKTIVVLIISIFIISSTPRHLASHVVAECLSCRVCPFPCFSCCR